MSGFISSLVAELVLVREIDVVALNFEERQRKTVAYVREKELVA